MSIFRDCPFTSITSVRQIDKAGSRHVTVMHGVEPDSTMEFPILARDVT